MGLKYSGIPRDIANLLLQHFPIKYFVETGTCHGVTASWASQQFDKVFTIEKSEELWNSSRNNFSHLTNVVFLLGDSREQLRSVLSQTGAPALIWLDAHWSGGKTYGKNDECPLLGELNVINNSSQDNFILVDDARLFMFPPPDPHIPDQWPNISQVMKLLDEKERYTVIFDDVIISIPNKAKPIIINLYQGLATEYWENSTVGEQSPSKNPRFAFLKKRLTSLSK